MYTRSQDQQDYPSADLSAPSSPFDQIDSSIGPTRVTRRQASLKQGHLRRVSLSSRPEDVASPSIQLQDATEPLLDSPSADRQADFHVASPHVSLQSPYHPNTPSSVSSPYSPFEHVRRSRARSTSHFEGRPQSPALSTTSGLTNSSHTLDDSISAESSNIPASPPTAKEKHKKHRLRDVDRKNICIHQRNNPNARQEDIGAFFGVERSTISKILKEKDRWLNISEEDECDQTTKHRPSKFPEIEEEMLNSLQVWSDGGVGITDQLIRQHALSIAKSFHITPDKFKGSSGWVENFKHRHDIRRGEWLRANKIPSDYIIHDSHSSAVPPTPVLMAYDQQVHIQGSEPQSPNCPLKPSGSHEDQDQEQDQQHVRSSLSATPAHWPDVMRSDVSQSPHPMIDPILQAQGPSNPLGSNHPDPHSLQNIQHSPEIQHQPQHLHHHQHHNHQQHQYHHNHNQQHQAVVYNAYEQSLCGPGVSAPHLNPTMADAEQAINILITFLDTNGRGIIKQNERQKLSDIKCALFQAANGLPYDRLVD